MKQVELIAAGYEWVCPLCDALNREIEVTEKVYCPECDEWFEVADYYHAHS